MDGLVMCGGRGTRLETATEKPLFEIGGRPMIERVCTALGNSQIEEIYCAVSPHTPETEQFLTESQDVRLIETPGSGYVADLGIALEAVGRPVLTVAADLPLLTGPLIDQLLAEYEQSATDSIPSLTVCVPTALKERLGVSADQTLEHDGYSVTPTGLNVVGVTDDEIKQSSHNVRLAVNVNRPGDAAVAEDLLCE